MGSKNVAPGPGAYETKGSLEGPMFSVQGRIRKVKLRARSLPGPGTYDPSASSNFNHESTSKYATSTKVGFGTSTREDMIAKHQKPAPGPGAYELQSFKTVGTDS